MHCDSVNNYSVMSGFLPFLINNKMVRIPSPVSVLNVLVHVTIGRLCSSQKMLRVVEMKWPPSM